MKKLVPIVVFIAVAFASVAMAAFAYVTAHDAAFFKFEATADDALNRIESRIEVNFSLLRTTQALFQTAERETSQRDFEAFFKALNVDKNFAGLRGVGFLRVAKRGDEAAVEHEIAEKHGAARAVHPQSELEWRTPLVLYEPLEASNAAGIGYDMFTDPDRRAAIQAAMTSHELQATGLVLLGQATTEGPLQPGLLVFSSVNTPADSGSEGNVKPADGVLFVSFRSAELFQASLLRTPLLPVNVEAYDGAVDGDNLLYRSEAPPASGYSDFAVERQIKVAGRQWTLVFRPTSAFSQPTSRTLPIMLGLIGLLFAGAIALVARYQDRAYDAVAQLHEATEKSLLEKELMLQEMKHRIKNSITRVLAMARQTAANSADVNEFSNSFAARLQAMAASQDMLTRSRWQKADLGDLLRIELGQVFGKELPAEMLSGPKLLLNEKITQALGLTFHELATNALKYGEAGNSVSALKVSWQVQDKRGDSKLHLVWQETGNTAVTEPEKTGFGTKLIDMNITRELGGTIARDFRPDGLVVEIVVPIDRRM